MTKNMDEAKDPEVALLIPVYNGGEEVLGVLRALRAHPVRVMVADDGSIDGTADRAEAEGFTVFRNGVRMGKGAALRRGLDRLFDLWPEAAWVVFMDGDGQHLPGELPRFLGAMGSGADLLCGTRLAESDKIPLRRLRANLCGSWFLHQFSGQRVPDTQCGYRAFRAWVLKGMEIDSSGFEVETEMLLKALRMGARWASVPVSAVYGEEQGSHFRPVHDTFRLCMAGLRYAR